MCEDTSRIQQSGPLLNEEIKIKQEMLDEIEEYDNPVQSIMENPQNTIKKEGSSHITSNLPQSSTYEEQPIKIEPITNLYVKEELSEEHQKLQCNICADVFKSDQSLKAHNESVHYPANTVQCKQCPRVYKNDRSLKTHVLYNHTAGRYICTTCEKAFYYKFALKNHFQKVHLGIQKSYPCDYCFRTFAVRSSKIMHERAIHKGERPAKCEISNFSYSIFSLETYLRDHKRIHTGERPFKCPICGLGHLLRDNMKSHLRNNHKRSEIDPEIVAKLSPSLLQTLKP